MKLDERPDPKQDFIEYRSRLLVVETILHSVSPTGVVKAHGILGPTGSGRSSMLNELVKRFKAPRGQVIKMAMGSGSPTIVAPGLIDRAIQVADISGRVAASSAGPAALLGVPHAAFIRTGGTALEWIARYAQRLRQAGLESALQPTEALSFVLKIDRPLLVLVDDLDRSDAPEWWWREFIMPLGRSLAEKKNHGALVLSTSEKIVAAEFEPPKFEWHELRGLDEQELRTLTGPSSAQTTSLLARASGGEAWRGFSSMA